MRNHFTPLFCLLILAGTSSALLAQSGNLLAELSTLNAQQSAQVLDYAHHLGAYYGKPVDKTCQMLDAKNQGRVLQYIHFLKNPAPPELTTVHWNLDTLHFPPHEEGAILMDSFVVTNTGNAPYVIRSTKTGCDCTVLSYSKFPIMPGDSEVIRVEFDTINKAGRATPGIVLYDNSRPNRRSILYLKAEIIPRGNVKIIYRN